MELTEGNKKHIDSLSYEQLLSKWRFAPMGDPWFQGETGEYWSSTMNKARKEIGQVEAVNVSKDIGW